MAEYEKKVRKKLTEYGCYNGIMKRAGISFHF